MPDRNRPAAACVALFLFVCAASGAQQTRQHVETRNTQGVALDHLLYLPPGCSDEGAPRPLVPLRESVDMVEAIRGAGGRRPPLTVYAEVGHDVGTEAYDDPAVWEWLFAQRRRPE